MKVRTRLDPGVRKAQLLEVALELAETVGYQRITREIIAFKAGVTPGRVSQCFNTMTKLKREVMRTAIARGNIIIVAQGLGDRDKQALKAPDALKRKAVDYLLIN